MKLATSFPVLSSQIIFLNMFPGISPGFDASKTINLFSISFPPPPPIITKFLNVAIYNIITLICFTYAVNGNLQNVVELLDFGNLEIV